LFKCSRHTWRGSETFAVIYKRVKSDRFKRLLSCIIVLHALASIYKWCCAAQSASVVLMYWMAHPPTFCFYHELRRLSCRGGAVQINQPLLILVYHMAHPPTFCFYHEPLRLSCGGGAVQINQPLLILVYWMAHPSTSCLYHELRRLSCGGGAGQHTLLRRVGRSSRGSRPVIRNGSKQQQQQ
jgi:hypothetical protein